MQWTVMIRLAHISDAHLSPRTALFDQAWNVLSNELARRQPQLVISTGDVALDAPDYPGDMVEAGKRHTALGLPLLAVPGNHDVGEPAVQDVRNQEVCDRTLVVFRKEFGSDFWTRDVDGWRLIGVNSQLVHSGHADEERQLAMLQEAVSSADDRKLAIFTHKPFELNPGELPPPGYWTMHRDSLSRYRFLLDDPRLRLIASGHLHEYRSVRAGNVLHVWGPSSAFAVEDAIYQSHGGERFLGFVEYTFADEVTHECVPLNGADTVWLGSFRAELYPPVAKQPAQAAS